MVVVRMVISQHTTDNYIVNYSRKIQYTIPENGTVLVSRTIKSDD